MVRRGDRFPLPRSRTLIRGEARSFPATTNGPSNGICRSVGFRFAGEQDVTFAARVIRTKFGGCFALSRWPLI
jgi:hypothetical protein